MKRSLLFGISLLALASSAMAEEIVYSNRASYPISMEPFFTAGIALGDIDGDGDLNGDSAPDIIAGNSEGANIAYYQTTRSD